MKDYLVKKLLLNRRLSFLDEKKNVYEDRLDRTQIVARQIQRFNMVWERCYKTIPFYTHWRLKHDLPSRISKLDDLHNFPLLTKRVIQENQDIIFQNGRIKEHVSTGGSTGQPTRFPSSGRDAFLTYVDQYVGRSWHGIEPLDSMLHFWGHSHLFGNGFKGLCCNYKRNLRDYILNIRRLSAYDMTTETMGRYADIYRRSNPTCVVGYTSCIYKLAKYIQENCLDCGDKRRLKAVIVTAETVAKSEFEVLQNVFKVPIVVEYGMAETGVIAYSRESASNIRLLWDSFIATVGSDKIINITTIYDKFFPLIAYHTEDIVEVGEEVDGSILQVTSILGRERDVLRVGCVGGSYLELSGILMVHVLKSYPHVFSIQFDQLEHNKVRIYVVGDRRLDLGDVKEYFLREIRKDHKNIDKDCIEITQVSRVPKTLAGKESMVVPQGG